MKYNNLRNLIAVFVVMLCVLGCGRRTNDSQSESMPEVKPEVIFARELIGNYSYNYAIANNDFKGKNLIIIGGTINYVGGSYFEMHDGKGTANIRVYLKNTRINDTWLRQMVNVKGTCTGGSASIVTIEDAEIVDYTNKKQ